MFKIIADSSANISQKEAKELGITVLPLGIIFDEEEYLDDVNITIDEFYNKLTSTKTFPKTSQLSMELLEQTYLEAKNNNEKILLILLSSKLSGTVSCANIVKNNGNYDNVFIYDSLGATGLNRILVDVALKNTDKEPEEVIKILDEVRGKIELYAAVQTLDYLHKGGRLSKTKAVVGNMLNLKPILTILKDGSLDVTGKAIGLNNSIKTIKSLVEKAGGIDENYPVYFLYAMEDKNGKKLQDAYPNINSRLINLCSIIGCHVGPGVAGIVFVAKSN